MSCSPSAFSFSSALLHAALDRSVTRFSLRTLLAPTLALALAACGGRQGPGPQTAQRSEAAVELQRLRDAAAARPSDPAVWALLAELELLGEAGDASRARAAIDHALELAPTQSAKARLHLIGAWEHELHGRIGAALEAHLAAVEAARLSDPSEEGASWSPVIAEVALDGIRGARGGVPGFDERVTPALERVLDEPGALGHAAVDAAAIALRGARERGGDEEAEEALADRLGCLREWRAAGPFGPYTNLSFDERLPAEAAGPLGERYDLRPGQEGEAPFDGEADGCRVSFAPEEDAAAGSTVAEAFVEIAEGGPKLLRIDTAASFKLYVDGELVHTVDRRRAIAPSYVFVPLELAAGRHELELKLTTHARTPSAVVSLDWPGRLGEGWEPTRGMRLPEPTSPAELLVAAHALQGRGDAVHAVELVGMGDGGPEASAALLVHRIDLLGDEPFLPDDRRNAIRTVLYQRAHERDPEALLPAIADVARREDPNEVFEGFVALRERFPEVVALRYIVLELLEERGRPREAEAELRRIRRDFPNECGPVERLRQLLYDNERVAEGNALVEDLVACDATSRARLGLLLEQRRWDAAREELERLAPFLEERALRTQRLRLAVQSGDAETERAIRAELMEEHPEARSTITRQVDRALAAGRRGEALSLLDAAAERDPTHMEGLRNLRRDLTGRDDMEAFRIDGAEVLESYQESGDPYPDAPQVLVLDYMVTRIYPDGSARHLVHQITRVQSEEAKDRLGQYAPRGRMLTLRTIKPDGRRLEPERIAGVDTIPLTDLAVGDYVEEEYIWTTGPRLNGGFLSAGWSFSSPVQPFHHSEMIAVVPDGVELTVERTGDAPEATEERRDGERVMRWLMQGVPIMEPEPNAVPVPPTWPTLRFGWRAGWEPHFTAERDFLMSRWPSHPAGRRACRQLMDGAPSREAAVGRVVQWVQDHIESTENSWGGAAPEMLLAGRGHPTRVVHYLLNECGVEAEIGLVRGVHAMEPRELARGSIYGSAVIVVPPEAEGGEPLVLFVGNRDASWRWVPSAIRGQEAVVLAEGFPRVPVPDPGPAADGRRYAIDVEMGAGGAARVRVAESHAGATASVWRRTFRQVPEAELGRLMRENYVGRLFPGATVQDFVVENAAAREEALRMGFVADVPRFGRPAGNAVLVPNLFATDLARALAQRPARETTLGVGAQSLEVVTTIRGIVAPEQSVARLPLVELEGYGGSRYRREARVEDGAVVVHRSLTLPEMNVPPEAYEAFAAFCRAVSQADVPRHRLTGRAEAPMC